MKQTKNLKTALFPKLIPLVFVLLFAAVGTFFVLRSMAASYAVHTEAESGILSSQASIISDSTASGAKAVRFQAQTGNGAAPAIRVSGKNIITDSGKIVVLRGVNRSGAEYMSVEAGSEDIWDGPTNDDASINAMKAWGVNTVRIPLNEDAWLGINGVPPAVNGVAHQNEIVNYVNRLNAHGIVAIINLHFSAPGTKVPTDLSPMPDAAHSIPFWTSVANKFKNNHSVIFDLFNEPYPDNNRNTTAAWQCTMQGINCGNISDPTGMQQMLNAVRATGATQPVMVAGPTYAGSFSRFMEFKPNDPLNQIIGSIHIYGLPLDSPDRTSDKWEGDVLPLANQIPVIISEFGDTDCTSKFSPPLMTWADQHGIGYTAWAWNTSNCADDPSLITNYNGTPTAFGIGVRDHMKALPKQW